jgi:hypothetical protein
VCVCRYDPFSHEFIGMWMLSSQPRPT